MGKEEITSAQYRHKCHSIHFEEHVKSHKNIQYLKLSTPWACDAIHVFCTRSRKYFKDKSMIQLAFSTVFRAACRWTDLKVSKHLDPWMLAITNKELFTMEVHHYRSCYHTYTLWVGSVTSCKSKTLHEAAEREFYEELFTAIRNKSCQINMYC